MQKERRQQHPSSRQGMRQRLGGPNPARLLRLIRQCLMIHLHAARASAHGQPGTFDSHFGEGTGQPAGCQIVVSAVEGLNRKMPTRFKCCLTSHRAG